MRPLAPQGFANVISSTLGDVLHDYHSGDRSSPSTSSKDDAGLPHRPSTDHVNMEEFIQFSDSDDSESDDDLYD